MRFLHTADWHLGRLFHGVHLTEDQAYLLDQLIELAKETRPSAVLLAGDVYDRAVPPPEAVELLDDVLARLVLGLQIPVVMIAGNHDSPSRLGFGARLLRERGLHIVGDLVPMTKPTAVFEDNYGPVHVYAVPYAEPAVVRERIEGDSTQDSIHTHDAALAALLDPLRAAHPAGARSVVVAHAFAAGGTASDSERPLSVGGADQVDPSRFEGFHYVALGHLHRPQSVGDQRIQYSGSLMKYSFAEADRAKAVNVVDLDASGECRVERVALRPRRDVRRIEGTLAELLNAPGTDDGREDYLMATLLDKGPVLDAMGRLRDVYPNLLHIERPFLQPGSAVRGASADHRRMSDVALFESFFQTVVGEPLNDKEASVFTAVVEQLRREQREDV